MADLEKSVAIIFEGVDKMGAGVDSATRRIDGLTTSVEQTVAPLASVTKGLLAAEGAAVAMAIAFANQAYDASVKFESAQKDLAKTLSDADGPVEQFTRRVLDLSNTYGESSTNILQSMANYRQAGFTAQEAAELVKNGLDLVIAGDVEAAEASEYLVSILKGFRAPASDAGEILEVLNATSNTYATSVGELAKGMAGISPIAKTMGFDFADTAQILTPVIEVFRSGDEAANALKTGLLKLLDDSKPVQEALKSIGVSQTDANGALRSGKDILTDISSAFGDMEESQKLAFTAQLVGLDQSARMVTVFDSLANNTVDVNKALQTSSTVAEEVAIKLGSAEGAGKRTAAAFENLNIAIGSQFRDNLAGIVSGFGDVFVAFEKAVSNGGLDELFDTLNPQLNEIERLAKEVADALPQAFENADYSGFTDGIRALLGDLSEVEIGVDDVQAVIEGLGETFRTLSNFTRGVGEVFAGLIGVVQPIVSAFLSLDSDTQKLIGTLGGISLAVGPAVAVLGTLTSAISGLAGSGGVISKAAPMLGRLALAFTGPAGLTVAAIAATPALIDLGAAMLGLETRADKMAKLKESLDQATKGITQNVESFAQLNKLIADGAVEYDQAAGYYVDAGKAMVTTSEAVNQAFEDGQASLDRAPDALRRIAKQHEDYQAKLAGTSDAMEQSQAGFTDWEAVVEDAFQASGGLTQSIVDNGKALLDQAAAQDKASGGWRKISDGVYEQRSAFEDVNKVLSDYRQQLDEGVISQSQFDAIEQYATSLQDGNEKAAASMKQTADASLKTEQAILEARQAANDYLVQMEQIASNERIKSLELGVELNIAALEADAKKVEAVFGSIDNTISSTGDLLGGLFGNLGSADSFRDKFAIEKQIKLENERRDEALRLQKEMTQAQIQQMRAKTDALRSGDGLIKISSDGLEPALETVMWQIIEKVQMRANAEGAEFLLGL